jgi:hypothetical protein
MNPRLAMRLFAFGAALAAGRARGVHVAIAATEESCTLSIEPPSHPGSHIIVAAPRLIEPSAECAAGVARAVGARLDHVESAWVLTLPRSQPE